MADVKDLDDRLAMAAEGGTLPTDVASALSKAKNREELNPQATRVAEDPTLASEYGLGHDGIRPEWQAEMDARLLVDPLTPKTNLDRMREELAALGRRDRSNVERLSSDERKNSSAILRAKQIVDNKPFFIPMKLWLWLNRG